MSQRAGHPSTIDDKARQKKWSRNYKEALQEFLESTGCVVHVTTILHILHMSGI